MESHYLTARISSPVPVLPWGSSVPFWWQRLSAYGTAFTKMSSSGNAQDEAMGAGGGALFSLPQPGQKLLRRQRQTHLGCRARGQSAGRGHKLQQRQLSCKGRKTFTVGLVKHCNRFPKEILESPSFEIFKTKLNKAMSNLL